jgi:small multidrug resistance pump
VPGVSFSPWALLAVAIVSEVIGTAALRESDGFTRPVPVAIMLVGYVIAFYLLSIIVRDVPVGIAYAIWAGAGTALIAVVGYFAFDEKLGAVTVAGIAMVIAGIAVIQLSSDV